MGFFKSISKIVKKVVKPVAKVVKQIPKVLTNPAKIGTTILTGGLNLVAPKVFNPLEQIVGNTLFNPQTLLGVVTKNPAGVLSSLTGSTVSHSITSALPVGGNMGLLDNLGGLGGIAKTVGSIFGGNQNPYFQGISNVAGIASQFLPPVGVPQGAATVVNARPVAAIAGPAMRSVATVGRGFFNKFPNLATAIQGYRNMGKNVTRAKLWSLVKRFGPEIVVSGGILTAAAVNELMIAGPGHRRMNPGNVKALRRSLRRLESFHHLCMKVDKLRRPRSRKAAGRGSTQQFVRQG